MPNKNIFSKFYNCATELVARNQEAAVSLLGLAYTAGDIIVAAIPIVENGFVTTLCKANPDWALLASAYIDRPLPALVSFIFVASSTGITSGRFALGHAGSGLGAALMALDLYAHGDVASACSFLPGIAGGAIGGLYKPLERKFQDAKNIIIRSTLGRPKKFTGYLFLTTNAPVVVTSYLASNPTLCTAAALWVTGNLISTLLPTDDVSLSNTQPSLPDKKKATPTEATPPRK
jgi:hypothetical protein